MQTDLPKLKFKSKICNQIWRDFTRTWEQRKKEWDEQAEISIARHRAEMDRWWKENYPTIPRHKKHD